MLNELSGRPQSTRAFQHFSFLPGSCPMSFHHGQGTWGKWEQKGKKKDDLYKNRLLKIQSKEINSKLYQHTARGKARDSSSKNKVPKWIKVKIKEQNFCLAPSSSQQFWYRLYLWLYFFFRWIITKHKKVMTSCLSIPMEKRKGSNPNFWHIIFTTANLCLSFCQPWKLNGQHCPFLMPVLLCCFQWRCTVVIESLVKIPFSWVMLLSSLLELL